MAKKRLNRDGAASMETSASNTPAASEYEYAGGVAIPKRSKGRKSILKLSRKQKLRKVQKAERAEAVSDRATAKGVRSAKKINRRVTARNLW